MTREQLLATPADCSEDKLQANCHMYMNHNYTSEYGRYFSVPNGGTRHKLEALKLKATGLTPGIPDYFLVSATGQFIPIEFKTETGTLTGKQPLVHANMLKVGVKVYIVRNTAEFLNIVDTHFNHELQTK